MYRKGVARRSTKSTLAALIEKLIKRRKLPYSKRGWRKKSYTRECLNVWGLIMNLWTCCVCVRERERRKCIPVLSNWAQSGISEIFFVENLWYMMSENLFYIRGAKQFVTVDWDQLRLFHESTPITYHFLWQWTKQLETCGCLRCQLLKLWK